MKKLFSFILVFLLIPFYLLSLPAFVDKPEASIGAEELLNMTVSAKLDSTVISEIGFSSNFIDSTQGGNPVSVSKVSLSHPSLTNGCFSNKPASSSSDQNPSTGLYAYWKISSSPESCPNVYLHIKNPLRSTTTNDSVNWKVSWDNGYINSVDKNSAVLFDHTTVTNLEGKLNHYVGSKELTIETTDAFWLSDQAVYSSELWVLIKAGK